MRKKGKTKRLRKKEINGKNGKRGKKVKEKLGSAIQDK